MPAYALKVEPKGHKLTPSHGPATPGAPQLSGNINTAQARLRADDETGLTGPFDFKLEWTPDGTEISRMTISIAAPPTPQPDSLGVSLIHRPEIRTRPPSRTPQSPRHRPHRRPRRKNSHSQLTPRPKPPTIGKSRQVKQ
jgi:hypothetical protein